MECMFSGDQTSNEEHILPRWMQRRFKLENETYTLPNGATLRYKHAKVPVAGNHNARFGKIEHALSCGTATAQEIYLWAFKIHIGLIFRNSNLKVDIKSLSASNFWELKDFGNEIWLFRQLYATWSTGGSIYPNPFGTVLEMKALPSQLNFDFIHNMKSGTLLFQLDDKVIFIVLYDQGIAANSNIATQFEAHRQRIASLPLDEQEAHGSVAQRV